MGQSAAARLEAAIALANSAPIPGGWGKLRW